MRNRKSKIYFFLLLSLVIFLADYLGFLKSVKGFFEKKMVIPVREFFKPQLVDECQKFEAERLNLKTQLAGLKEEVVSSRKLLGAPLPANWQFLPVKVIGDSDDEIIVGGGDREGIKLGMAAVYEGVFLGKVEKVSQEISKIKLLSNADSKQVVKILGKNSLNLVAKGLLFGRGKGEMEIKEILAEEEVEEGDLVVATVEGFDLPVGEITGVNYQKGDVFKTAGVRQKIKTRYLQTIFLLTGKI